MIARDAVDKSDATAKALAELAQHLQTSVEQERSAIAWCRGGRDGPRMAIAEARRPLRRRWAAT